MSKLVDYLIDEVRESSENEDFSDTVGLTEEEVLKFINDAQYRLHSKILSAHPTVFLEEDEQNVVADQENYTLKANAYLGNRVAQVDYSPTGQTADYYPLRPFSLYNRRSGASGHPTHYIRKAGEVLLSPVPTTAGGKIRITYSRKIKRLDKRRGVIKAVTTSGSTITNLEINYVNGTTVDQGELNKRTKITVVDKYGDIKMDNILVSSYSSSASYDKTIDVDSSFAFLSGETIAVDDYVVSGRYTTTHSEFDESVERYIQAYAVWKILNRDSSVDNEQAAEELLALETEIIQSYAELTDDISEIPEISDTDDWF